MRHFRGRLISVGIIAPLAAASVFGSMWNIIIAGIFMIPRVIYMNMHYWVQ